jgi:hypothetical protein
MPNAKNNHASQPITIIKFNLVHSPSHSIYLRFMMLLPFNFYLYVSQAVSSLQLCLDRCWDISYPSCLVLLTFNAKLAGKLI